MKMVEKLCHKQAKYILDIFFFKKTQQFLE